jgi:hypothetical protein
MWECLVKISSKTEVFPLPTNYVKIKTYKTIILTTVMYGYENLYLTLQEEQAYVFEKMCRGEYSFRIIVFLDFSTVWCSKNTKEHNASSD